MNSEVINVNQNQNKIIPKRCKNAIVDSTNEFVLFAADTNNQIKLSEENNSTNKEIVEKTNVCSSKESNKFIYSNTSHIGTDEFGSCDYFGPVCVVSCFIDKTDLEWLNQFNLSNVKELTNEEIINLAKDIKERIVYSLLILDNPHYNTMISDGLNPASIKAKLFNQAITNVMQKINKPISKKVVSNFVASKTYYNYLKNEVIVVKGVEFENEAHTKYFAVACAYILSKYAFIQYFNNMSNKLKINLPYGANMQSDKAGVRLVNTYGDAILNKVAKKHFANTRKILELKKECKDK